MKKIYLSVIGFSLLCRLNAWSQVVQASNNGNKPAFSLYTPVGGDTTIRSYNPRALRLDEINLFSSYYLQDGDHSAVTGGIGTEHVTDISNGIDLNFVWLGNNLNKNTLSASLGFDHHTSASSAYVALNGGASTGGTRVYPSLDWTVENAKTGGTFGAGAYYSGEYNYKSKGLDLHWSTKTDDKNGEFGVKLQGYFDEVKLIYPSEFVPKPSITVIPPGSTTYTTASGNTVVLSTGGTIISNTKTAIPSSARNTFTAAFSYSQIINSRLQVMFLGDVVEQHGYLGLPFHRVYFTNGTDQVEKLPSQRFKLPLGVRANYFLGDNLILRSYYRYYADSWGSRASTVSLEVAYKITPFFSVSPFYRFYTQTASMYFAPYEQHSLTDEYYTSNYEYSAFKSQFFGVGFRMAPPKGVLGWQSLHELEIRYGHYATTTDLASNVVSLSLGFK
jgi:hypothetical protein